jgi:hypothetical protein
MVVIKNSEPAVADDAHLAVHSRAVLLFQKNAADMFKKAGAVITGLENDMVTACFGSPLERVYLGGKRRVSPYEDNIYAKAEPARRAVGFVSEIAKKSECGFWSFGLDMGNCTFAWTAIAGYFALGSAVRKARALSRLAGKYNARIVISSAVSEALPDLAVKKLDVIKGKDGSGGEPFYALAVRT